jgi:predicted PurR-regulated permease PerM
VEKQLESTESFKSASEEVSMLSIDDRAGNVMTTVAIFVIGASILYLARGAFFILLLSLLFAYLLEPAVTFLQRHSRLSRKNRTWAIAQVYLAAFLLLGGLGYEFGPHLIGQIKNLNAALPQIFHELADGNVAAQMGTKHSLSSVQQQRIHNWLASNHDVITRIFERVAASAAYVATSAVWLFAVPILAIFILRDGRQLADTIVNSMGRQRNKARIHQILVQVDEMLAKYIRAQLALAGLSFVFYGGSMLFLKFPFAIPLGLLGGILEFLPGVGWVVSAAIFLSIGFLTHAHWIWMGVLLVLWRLVQDYVNSPRIMGNNLQLQPLTVLFALMVGGQVGGIAGLYLSVPTVAVLRIVWLGCFPSDNPAEISEPQLA